MIPTAISITLPRMINSLNSLSIVPSLNKDCLVKAITIIVQDKIGLSL
jgi:hypothetical protein